VHRGIEPTICSAPILAQMFVTSRNGQPSGCLTRPRRSGVFRIWSIRILVLHNCFRATGTKNHDFRAFSGSTIVGSIPRRALGCFRASQATRPPNDGSAICFGKTASDCRTRSQRLGVGERATRLDTVRRQALTNSVTPLITSLRSWTTLSPSLG